MTALSDKLKEVEQVVETVKKIENQTKDSNFDWSLIFPQENKNLHLGWLVASILVYFIICATAVFFSTHSHKAYIFIFIAGLMASIWVACTAHLRFDKSTITGLVALTALIGFLVAIEIVTPTEAAQELKGALPGNSLSEKPKQ